MPECWCPGVISIRPNNYVITNQKDWLEPWSSTTNCIGPVLPTSRFSTPAFSVAWCWSKAYVHSRVFKCMLYPSTIVFFGRNYNFKNFSYILMVAFRPQDHSRAVSSMFGGQIKQSSNLFSPKSLHMKSFT